jgi:hypothetical protein
MVDARVTSRVTSKPEMKTLYVKCVEVCPDV